MLLGDILLGKYHCSSPTATHKEDNQKTNHAPTSSHNGSPYLHDTGITNFNTSISQIHNYSINALYMKVFIIPILDAHHIRTNFIAEENYHAVLKDSQNNISEA